MCNTRGMDTGRFRELLPPAAECHPSVEELFLVLEASGWYPDKVIAGRSMRFYPEFQRPRQIVIDFTVPLNMNKIDFYRGHTQLDFVLSIEKPEEE